MVAFDLELIEENLKQVDGFPRGVGSVTDELYNNQAKLIAEVKRLRGEGLKEYHWSAMDGPYCGGFEYTVVAESLEKAKEYAREHLSENEFRDIGRVGDPCCIMDVTPKLSGYYEYHMDPGG
jgi:hypothetical protein